LVCDHSIASATGIFGLEPLAWDRQALSFLGIDAQQLPMLAQTTSVMHLTGSASARLGLDPATRVVLGASDGCLSNLGAGAIKPGCAAITIGTSGAVRSVVPKIRIDEQMRTFCYVLTGEHFVVGGAVNGGGMALQWAKDQLYTGQAITEDEAYDELIGQAAGVSAGSDGLLFHPYLTGERAPIYNSEARASFIGLSFAHTRAHMLRAVMEGILLNLDSVLRALESVAGRQDRIVAVGGFSRSTVWRQMMVDVFGRQIEFPADIESSALGAARLAFFALGEVSLLDAFVAPVGVYEAYRPQTAQADAYARLKPIFERVPSQLEAVYASLAKADLAVPRGTL
jgi:gluconokinase